MTLLPMTTASEKRAKLEHERRALEHSELARLLDAAVVRPVHGLLTVRRGPRKGQLVAKVRAEVIDRGPGGLGGNDGSYTSWLSGHGSDDRRSNR
jgi:hypothetical protein